MINGWGESLKEVEKIIRRIQEEAVNSMLETEVKTA